MQIQVTRSASRRQQKGIDDLYNICQEYDPVSIRPLYEGAEPGEVLTLLLTERGQVLAFLSAEEDGDALEISAFTHPAHRKKGLFTRLLQELYWQYPGKHFSSLYFQCDEGSADTMGYIKHTGCVFIDREHLMSRDMEQAEPISHSGAEQNPLTLQSSRDPALLVSLYSRIFSHSEEESAYMVNAALEEEKIHPYVSLLDNTYAGLFFLQTGKRNCYLFSFGLLPEFRGRGLSRSMMELVFSQVPDSCLYLLVQVAESNAPAFALYQSSGFRLKEALARYRLNLK